MIDKKLNHVASEVAAKIEEEKRAERKAAIEHLRKTD